MKRTKRILSAILCGAMLLGCMGGCEKKTPSAADTNNEDVEILNFVEPEVGDQIVKLTIQDFGEVTFRLFPEQCPKGVKNFLGLVKQGYYDELIFHRVVQDFVIQGGDPKGDGTGGASLWGDGFAQEITSSLCHFTGALAYAVGSDKLNKSQFYVVTGEAATAETFAQLESYYGKTFSDRVKSLYFQYGGQPYLDNDYEVFGQVIDGLEVCLAINDVATNSSSKPTSQVLIEKAEILEYDGSGVHYTAE